MNKPLTALLCLGLLATAGPAAAQVPFKPKVAKFKVTLKGVQATDWNSHHAGTGGCNPTVKQSGTEVARFASTRPVRVKVLLYGRHSPPIFTTGSKAGDPAPRLELRAKVTRRSTISADPTPWYCQALGGANSQPPDCGTRRVTAAVVLHELIGRRRDRIHLTSNSVHQGGFKTCPSAYPEFPSLLVVNSKGGVVAARLPRREIYDRSLGKLITIARGYRKRTSGETTSGTSVRWEASFRRVR
jgi:hypothetical protein